MTNIRPTTYIRKRFYSTQHFGAVVDGIALTMCGKDFHGAEFVIDHTEERRGRDTCRSCRAAWNKATSHGEHHPAHLRLPVGRQWFRKIEIAAL